MKCCISYRNLQLEDSKMKSIDNDGVMNMERKEKLKNLIYKLHEDANFEDVKKEFEIEFGSVDAGEIAALEGELIREGMPVEEVQRLCNVHAAVFQGSIEEIHAQKKIDETPGHPLFVFRRENDGLENYLRENLDKSYGKYKLEKSENNKLDLLADLHGLRKLEKHYERKENLFFPYLEREGITAPPKVMWAVDDDIRELMKKAISDVEENSDSFEETIDKMIFEIREMIKKENEILTPLLIQNLKAEDWKIVGESSSEIGYAFNGGIEGASPSDAVTWLEGQEVIVENKDLEIEDESEEGFVKFPSGIMEKSEMIHMFNTIPCDLTYIGDDDLVSFFTEGKNPVFPRTRTIIGRDVRNCHPPKAVPVVEQMLEDFKSGIKDEEIRLMTRGSKIFVIRYFAVRDEEGKYVGTLETTEEVSELYNIIKEEVEKTR